MRKFLLLILSMICLISLVSCKEKNELPSIPDDTVIDEKTEHICNHICETCGKCTDPNCAEPECSNKCLGHEPIATPHVCNHICEICGKCTDPNCTEPECSNKCQGHEPVYVPHECNHICEICGKCTDPDCAEPECSNKCQGHVVTPPQYEDEIKYGLYGYGVGTTGGHTYVNEEFTVPDNSFVINLENEIDIETQIKSYQDSLTNKANTTVILVANNGTDIINTLTAKKNLKKAKAYEDFNLIVYIDGTITLENSSIDTIEIKEMSNVSIIGVDDRGEFNGIGLKVNKSTNVIIQNLKIHHVLASSGEGDGINIVDSTYIWVDHNEFYNEFVWDPNVSSSVKDKYDALLDIKKSSNNITISYNIFHHAWKTNLIGYTSSDNPTDRCVTYYCNYYYELCSRLPLIRGGQTHIFNSYYENVYSSAINCRVGAKVKVEGVTFNNVKNPVACLYDSSGIGYWNLSNNDYINCMGSSTDSYEIPWSIDMTSTTDYEPNYEYFLYSNEQAVEICKNNTGINKYTIDSKYSKKYTSHIEEITNEINNLDDNYINAIILMDCFNKLSDSEKSSISNYKILNDKFDLAINTLNNAINNKSLLSIIDIKLNNYNNIIQANLSNETYEIYNAISPIYYLIINNNNNSLGDAKKICSLYELLDEKYKLYTSDIYEIINSYKEQLENNQNIDLFFDASNEQTLEITSEVMSNDGFFMIGPNTKIVARTVTISDKSFTKYLDLCGTGSITNRYIKFEVSGPCVITIYGSANKERTLNLSNGTEIVGSVSMLDESTYELTINTSGTYFLYSANSGIRIYGLIIK